MAEYIATLPMSAFVMDYDYNAPDVRHLQKTHEPFFKTIRNAHPTLPVLMVSRPEANRNAENRKRFAVIRRTYENALNSGDKNVYFLDGSTFFADSPYDDPTVDGIHPTDYGFYLMAKGMEETLRKMLK